MKKLACSLLTIIILLTISCEIGLGESVDTDPPSLTIDANIADKIIRDDFALRGVYTDDGTITKLSAILKRTDGTGDPLEFTGVYEETPKKRGTGTWTINIPAKTNPIKDGTYQADVSITDGVGRVTTQSTIFTIDNTPPIIILTRPSSSIQSSSSDTYGQKFTIEGAAAETNNIGLMEIQLYSDSSCTQLVTEEPIVLRNVPISIEVEAANYDVEAAKYIYEGVTKQFNIEVPTDGEGQQFYYKLFAYDGAERYLSEDETPTDEDSKGNRTECFYLQKDIYEPIGQYYSTTELYAILSGNYTEKSTSRAASAPDITKVKADLLNDTETGYQRKIGKFILNPKNNPTYTITGRTPLADQNSRNSFDSTDNELTNGGQVIIEVSPGLDGHILNEDSIKVYTKRRYFNADGTFKEDGAINYFDNSKLDIKTSGSAYKYITTINREDGFEIGGYYIIGVEGKDVKGNEIVASGTNPYGIKLTSNGRPPAITITEPSEATTYTNKKQIFKGTVEVELGTPTINIYKGSVSDATKITTIDCSASAGAKEGSSYVYNFTYEDASFDGTTKNQKFIFEAEVGGSKSAQPERTVVYDMDAPTYVITKPATAKKFTDAIGTEATGAFLNGTVEFSVMLNDKGGSGLDAETNKPVWEVLDASSPTAVLATGVIEETTGENVTIDTTASQFLNKSIIFRVTAWDIAGNKKSSSSEDSKYTFVVDQNTDKPYLAEEQNYKIDFNLNNIDENGNISGDSVDVVDRYHNQSAESRKGTVEKASGLKFYVYDDDGTTEVSIRNKKLGSTRAEASATGKWENDVSKLTEVDKYTVDTPNKLVAVSSYTFPPNDSDCGYYEYAVVVTDKNDTTKQTVKGPFLVRITQDRASITVTADKKYSNRNVAFTNTISITPSDGPYKIYRQVVREGEATYADDVYTNTASDTDVGKYKLITDENGIDELTYSDNKVKIGDYYSSAADDKDITVYYKVLDSLGLWSIQKSVLLKVDNGKPTLVLNTPAAGKKGIDALNATTPFTGTVKDEVNGVKQSGVKQILYKFVPLDSAGNATENPDYEIATFTDGPFALPMKDFIPANQTTETEGKLKEGSWKLYIKAQDEAVNESDVVEREFDIDLDNPILTSSITTSTIANDAYQCKETGGKYFFNGELKGTASATDTAGAATLLFKIGNTELTSSAVSFNGNNWSIAAANFAEGQQTLTITAKDWVGKTTPVTYTVYKDTTAPQLTADNPGAQSFAPTINGTVSDNSGAGVKQIYWSKTGKNATDFAPITYKTESGDVGYTTGAPDWKFTVPAFSDSEPEATKTYWFKAEDNLSNKTSDDDSDAIKVSFEYDKAAPTVTLTDESTTAIYKNTNAFTISGTAHDSNKLKNIYIEQNGELIETISTGAVKDYSWSKDLSGLTNRRHTFTIYAEDAAGKKSQILTQEIVVDTLAPTVEITNPANNNSKLTYALRTNTTFTGTVQDNVAGADKVFCLISKSEPENTNSFVEATIANGEWSYTPESLTEDLGYKLYVYAVDKARNSTATGATPYVIREFDVDNANPTISSVTVDEQYNKASTSPFTVEVAASDTHSIADNGVIISWGTAADQSATMTYDTSATKYKKDFSFGTSGALLPDGNYTFTITAKDKANKEVTTTKAVMIDTNAPEIGSLKINGTAIDASNWYGSKTLAVSVDVTDNVSDVQKVEYTLNDGTTWNEIYKQGATGNTYGGTVDFAGGTNTIKVRAVDYAGNLNDTWTPAQVKIDDTAAELSAMYYQVGSNPVAEIASPIYVKSENSVTGAITLYGKYYDGESGLKEGLTFTIGETTTQTCTSLGYYTPDNSTPANPTAADMSGFTYGAFASGAKYWKAEFTPSAEGTLTISGKNNADKTSSESPSKIKIDNKKPEFTNITLSNAYKKDAATFFVNNEKVNNQEKIFTLEGSATDNYGLVDISLSVVSGSNTLTPAKIGDDVSSWKFEITNMSTWTTSATATLTLKDIAGHITTQPITINFDTTPPTKKLALDAKNKDLYFRIGKADNDDNAGVTATDAVGKWNDTLDKDVGKKYEENSYGNDNTIQLRGFFEDGENGSGVKMIYYKVYDTWDGNTTLWPTTARTPMTNLTEAELEKLISDVGQTNAIKPGAKEERRVFYNVTKNATDPHGGTKFKTVGDYDQYFKTIESNFNASISGFSKPVNYLVFVVEDNVGNKQVVQTTVNNISYANFKMNVDNTPPEITSNATSIITTRSNTTYGAVPPVTITGTLTDNTSGINENSFEITINGVVLPSENITQLNKTDSVGKEYAWEIEIPATIMAAVGKTSFSVMASVRDNAGTGNLKTDSIASISLDDIPPTLSFTSSGGIIKDSFAVSVHANDANGIDGNKVYYKLYNASETPSEMPSDTDSYVSLDSTKGSYEISIDTSANTFTDNQQLKLRVYAKDGAGNVGYLDSNLYTIDKNPPALVTLYFQKDKTTSIAHSAINSDTWFKNTALTINGTFKDVISGENATDEGSGVKVINYKVGTNTGSITPSYDSTNKVYTFSANIDDFEEQSGNNFEIWAEDQVGNSEVSHHPLSINVDTVQPSIDGASTLPDYSSGEAPYTVSGTFNDGTSGSGVASIVVKLGTGTNAKTYTISNPTGSTWSYNIPAGDLTAYANNQVKIDATATDKAGNSYTATIKQIIIDMQAPYVKLESPQNAVSGAGVTDIYVNGVISLSGISNDNYIIDNIIDICYSTTETTKPTASVATYETWTVPEGWHRFGNNYAVGMTTESNNSKWEFVNIDTTIDELDNNTIYFTAAVIDKAGRVGYAEPIRVKVDQDTNRPIIKITSMLLDGMSSISYKGSTESEITGNVSDDDGVPRGLKYSLDGTNFITDGLVYSTSDGQFTLTLEDGEHTIYFEVETNEEVSTGVYKKFTTMASPDTQLADTPKLTDRNGTTFGAKGENTNKNTVYYMYIDKDPPEVRDFAYSRTYDAETWGTSISGEYFGGPSEGVATPKNTFYISQTAKDANGVKKVYLSIPADATDTSSDAITAWEYKFGSVKKIIYTQGNQPSAAAAYWNDYDVSGTSAGNISTVAANNTSVTIGEETYNRIAYIFALEDTESGKNKMEYHIWKTPENKPVDVTGLASGEKTASLIAYDGTRQTAESKIIWVDNSSPIVTISAPETVSSSAVVNGSINDGTNTSVTTVSFAVTKTDVTEISAESWESESHAGATQFKITFDGSEEEDSFETHAHLLKQYLLDLEILTQNDIDTKSDKARQLQPVHVWIRSVDNCNNVGYQKQLVYVDALGNIPTVSIAYPTLNAQDQTLGGTISIMGSAKDNIAPKLVWLQFDVNRDGQWTTADYELLKTKYQFGNMKTNTDLSSGETVSSDIGNVGIKVTVDGGSWSKDIDTLDLFSSEDQSSNTIKMWAYASDDDVGDGSVINVSRADTRVFNIDKDNPYFKQDTIKLVQYSTQNDPTTTPVRELPYTEGMYIKGIWWIEGEVRDNSAGIKEIKKSIFGSDNQYGSDASLISSTGEELPTGEYRFTKITETAENDSTTTIYNYNFKIKVGDTSVSGRNRFKIKVKENKPSDARDAEKEFIVYYDNKAPTFATPTNSSDGIATEVKNDNGFYGMHSVAYEASANDSGIERVAVYFTRTIGDDTYIFDPMYKRGATVSNNDVSKIKITDSLVQDTTGDKLYWGSATAADTNGLDGVKVTLTAAVPSYVHVGGLAKIDDFVYRIQKISDDKETVTLSSAPNALPSDKKVYFAVANVVDNTKEEKKPANPTILTTVYGYGYASKFDDDDSDGIMEYLKNVDSTTWNWNLYINSKNIPDGTISIHYVIFDKAGNTAYNSVNASVENNKPRLVGVTIGRDVNQDGTIATTSPETITYYENGTAAEDKPTLYKNGATTITIPNKITIKSKMEVTPEIVGGNGKIYYKIKKKGDSDYVGYGTSSAAIELMDGNNAYDNADWDNNKDHTNTSGALVTQSATITHDLTASNKVRYQALISQNDSAWSLSYMLYDSKEAGEVNKVYINIPEIDFAVYDEDAPSVTITPFYWKQDGDIKKSSALYEDVTIDQETKTVARGHIDLNGELPTSFDTSKTGVNDRDDKVSGIIKIEGTATDTRKLSALYISIPGMETYFGSDNANLTKKTVNSVDYYKISTYESGAWTDKAGNLANYGFVFQTSGNSLTDAGHAVNWTFTWDTSKISTVTATNVNINVLAEDAASEASASTTTPQNRTTAGNRKVDVVPYITKLVTDISESAGEEFARSATGKYIVKGSYLNENKVATTETVKVYGFNLATTANSKNSTTTIGTLSTGGSDEKDTKSKYLNLAIGTGSSSGLLAITVNDISSLNNVNQNPEFEDGAIAPKANSKAMYNSQANDETNNRLTDDVELVVWDMNYFLNETNITSPMMKMDKSGNYYMSYGEGVPSMYVNKNGTTRQVDYSYNKFHNTNVIYDDNGNIYAVATNTDRISDASARFTFYTPLIGETMPATIANNKPAYQYSTVTKRHLEQVYNGSTTVYDINRVMQPKLASYTKIDGTTYLGLVYYDYNNTINPVKVRFGTRASSYTAVSNTDYTFKYVNGGSYFYTSNNKQKLSGAVKIGNNYYALDCYGVDSDDDWQYKISGYTGTTQFTSKIYTFGVGGLTGSTDGGTGQSNNPATTDSSASGYHIVASDSTTDFKGGQYAAVGIVPKKNGETVTGYVGVVAWYDAKASKVCYSYNESPETAVTGGAWQTNAKYIDTAKYSGWYVDLAVDDAGHIHIAYYNSAKGDLRYVYLNSYNADPSTPVTVDSFNSVGTNITVNVRKQGDNYVPYIYYYNASGNQTTSSIKVAWQKDTTLRNGAVGDKFTGAWECMTIPSANVPVDATVCGGVPTGTHTGTNVINYSKTVVLGYMTDKYYEKAYIKGDIY